MGKDSGKFRFKRFALSHSRSSMKIGVDGVMVACWARIHGDRILDVGTGCGVIAAICAQRNADAQVDAIDIDEASVDEATANFKEIPFSDRLSARKADFLSFIPEGKYDSIVSNPPFFNSGVEEATSARMGARHQLCLNVDTLLEHAASILTDDGLLTIILPESEKDHLQRAADRNGMCISRLCHVRGHEKAPYKRIMAELSVRPVPDCEESFLTMMLPDGTPTDEYRSLCGDFYLYF